MGAQPFRVIVGMASGCCFTRSTGISGAQQGFEKSQTEQAEAVAQGDSAGKPRGTMLAFTHSHEAKIECDFWRCEFAERDGRKYVFLPDATGIKSVGDFGITSFLRQRADGKADFAMMRSDDVFLSNGHFWSRKSAPNVSFM